MACSSSNKINKWHAHLLSRTKSQTRLQHKSKEKRTCELWQADQCCQRWKKTETLEVSLEAKAATHNKSECLGAERHKWGKSFRMYVMECPRKWNNYNKKTYI